MLGVTTNALPRARGPFDNGINRFEMTGICRETNLDLGAGGKFSDGVITKMIFHVAIAGDQLGNVILAELGKDNAK